MRVTDWRLKVSYPCSVIDRNYTRWALVLDFLSSAGFRRWAMRARSSDLPDSKVSNSIFGRILNSLRAFLRTVNSVARNRCADILDCPQSQGMHPYQIGRVSYLMLHWCCRGLTGFLGISSSHSGAERRSGTQGIVNSQTFTPLEWCS